MDLMPMRSSKCQRHQPESFSRMLKTCNVWHVWIRFVKPIMHIHTTLLTTHFSLPSAPHLFEINKISQLPHAHFASFCKLSYAFRSSDITTASHEPTLDRCNSSLHICHCPARPNHKLQIASHCLLAEQYLPLIIQMCVWVYIT